MDFTQSTLAGLHVWALMSALQASISQVGVLLPIVLRADLTHSENKDGAKLSSEVDWFLVICITSPISLISQRACFQIVLTDPIESLGT